MTTTVDIEQVTEFARTVRGELADLGPDVIDELTDGLEADLADKLADGEPLGDAAAYAAELRAAAGVAPASRLTVVDNVRANLADLRSRLEGVAKHPMVAAVIAFLVALRPLWWVLRGWALFYILAGFTSVPQNQFDPWLLVVLVVLSIQWGRGRWLPWKWSRAAVVALSVVAVLAVPAVVTSAVEKLTFADRMDPNDYIPLGLLLNREPVSNIFAYGPDGTLLTDVRLYDQSGVPLGNDPGPTYWLDEQTVLVPSDDAGTGGWNVYPLDGVQVADLDDIGAVPSWAKRLPQQAPFTSVPPLRNYEPADPQP
jgi:hypothetical protein